MHLCTVITSQDSPVVSQQNANAQQTALAYPRIVELGDQPAGSPQGPPQPTPAARRLGVAACTAAGCADRAHSSAWALRPHTASLALSPHTAVAAGKPAAPACPGCAHHRLHDPAEQTSLSACWGEGLPAEAREHEGVPAVAEPFQGPHGSLRPIAMLGGILEPAIWASVRLRGQPAGEAGMLHP